jgi:SAM-dependent methyltransferase
MTNKIGAWETYYQGLESLLLPNEYVTRTFVGNYPNLALPKDFAGKRICDVSCGDGRNLILLHQLKFELYGTEVTDAIAEITTAKLRNHPFHIEATIRRGTNDDLPYEDGFFDFVLSWNACYYMRDAAAHINEHVTEFARIMKPGAVLVCSVPSPMCYSLLNSIDMGDDLIRLDPPRNEWGKGLLKDHLLYSFKSFEHIEKVFGTSFHDFRRCKLSDDCYGLPLDYFIFVCRKR